MPFDRRSSGLFLILSVLVSPTTLSVFGQSNTSNASQTVIADSNSNGLNSPGALAVAADGNVLIVDTGNNRVVEEPWNSSTKAYGAQTVLIGNLYSPDGAAVSANGNVFIADTGNNRVIEIPWNPTSRTYGEAAEIGSGLNNPHGVSVAGNGDVYIADTGNNRVVELPWNHASGAYGAQTTVGVNLLSPEAVAVGSGGKVYIADLENSSVVEVSAGCSAATSGTSPTAVASQETNGLANPTRAAAVPIGKVYVPDPGNSSAVEVPAGCSAVTSGTSPIAVASQETNGLANPTGVVVGPSGNLYIADSGNNRVIVLPWNLSSNSYGVQKGIGADLVEPKAVALDAMGNVYIADTGNNRVIKITQSGRNRPTGNYGGFRMRP